VDTCFKKNLGNDYAHKKKETLHYTEEEEIS
jgi:hypothetical protein